MCSRSRREQPTRGESPGFGFGVGKNDLSKNVLFYKLSRETGKTFLLQPEPSQIVKFYEHSDGSSVFVKAGNFLTS
jgi:hypothetical protein